LSEVTQQNRERERERDLARIKHHYNQKKNLHYSPGKPLTMMMIPHAWKNQSQNPYTTSEKYW